MSSTHVNSSLFAGWGGGGFGGGWTIWLTFSLRWRVRIPTALMMRHVFELCTQLKLCILLHTLTPTHMVPYSSISWTLQILVFALDTWIRTGSTIECVILLLWMDYDSKAIYWGKIASDLHSYANRAQRFRNCSVNMSWSRRKILIAIES